MTEERPIDRRFRRFDLNDTRPRSEPVAKCPGGTVRSYRTRTFQEEYLAFLKKHGAHFDEKYLWDQLRTNHTVPYGTVLLRDAFPGTSCLATVMLSLWDKMQTSRRGFD